jgi:sigma-54 dependent transcriptional regulator, acetoin dehydrogenase operon transcriptional activator AcoR
MKEISVKWGETLRDKERLKTIWEKFVYYNQIDPNLDELVKQSWLRSVFYGVNPHQEKGKKILSPKQLERCLRDKSDLLRISLPLMQSLYTLVQGSGFLVILCDENGLLLKMLGDPDTLFEAKNINFVEGANWSEEAMGTNAIGTCIKLDKPIQIYAAEHFSKICQSWTCSASPIHDPEGKIIGVLNMSGPFEKVHPHTLGMVVSAVEAIENQLKLIEKSKKNEIMQSYLEATINTLTEGVLIVTQEGSIIKTNEILLKMIKIDEQQIIGHKLNQVFGNEIMKKIAVAQTEIVDKEISLKVNFSGEIVHVLLNVKPIISSVGKLMGSLIMLKEIKKVRQFIHNLTGSQAKVTFADIIGNSLSFLECIKEAKLAACSNSSVLLMGESGTGKDLFAQAIHNESDRRKGPFIAINCGAIPRDLLGSELFGYVEGAFTGARKGGSAGKFELADGGTLFLDEIGEMSLEMQVLLLRVLQDKEVVRIGGHKVIPVDVRIIAATNKNLEREVKKGSFRKDLFYRLNVIPIKIPSLRNRKEDIPLLVSNFTKKLNHRLGKQIKRISPRLMDLLTEYDWPGNVRELQNVLERTIIRSTGDELLPEFLPIELKTEHMPIKEDDGLPLKEEIKKQALIQSIRESNGNFKQAARLLGISRSTLYRQLEKYNLEKYNLR